MSKFTKEAKAELLPKLAEIEQYDREQAFELGFAKAAKELKLDEGDFKTFYQAGCEKMAAAVEEQAEA